MGFLVELVSYVVMLAIKPFSLLKIVVCFCLDAIVFVARESLRVVKSVCDFYTGIFWKVSNEFVDTVTLPVRVLTALRREKLLDMQVQEMRKQLECLLWGVKELESKLRGVMYDKEALEEVLEEVEDEHDKSVAKISILEEQINNLREENHRLSDAQKRLWESKTWESSGVVDIGIPWNSGFPGTEAMLKEPSAWEREKICKTTHSFLTKPEQQFTVIGMTPGKVEKKLEKLPMVTSVDRQRGAALQQSLFSAFMSVLVGIIVWEAEDPCMPLVIALFIVVVMSLNSVVKFFSTIENRPASNAVALLSFNWFILGTLAYPTLPSIARLLLPSAFYLINRLMCWFGLTSNEPVGS